jgi:hypothetical protein
MKQLLVLIVAAWMLLPDSASATCGTQNVQVNDNAISYRNSCTDAGEILIQTEDALNMDACTLMSTTGVVNVFATLESGANPIYSTAPLSLTDGGAVDTSPVLVTVALRIYYFTAKFRGIQVKQSGATDAQVTLICWNY